MGPLGAVARGFGEQHHHYANDNHFSISIPSQSRDDMQVEGIMGWMWAKKLS